MIATIRPTPMVLMTGTPPVAKPATTTMSSNAAAMTGVQPLSELELARTVATLTR
jgi:hypothetical protein